VLWYSRAYVNVRKMAVGEFHSLALFSTLGMLCLVSANSLLMLYLGLELLSLPLYALVALDRHSKTSSEASMKYFVMGAIASGLLLYGISLVYGVTGTIQLPEVAAALQGANQTTLYVALGFIVAGIAFKFGAVIKARRPISHY